MAPTASAGRLERRARKPPSTCVPPVRTGFAVFEHGAIEQSIAARFEQQVEQHGGCLAVRTRAHRLTYAELNGEANRIAAAILAARGRARAGRAPARAGGAAHRGDSRRPQDRQGVRRARPHVPARPTRLDARRRRRDARAGRRGQHGKGRRRSRPARASLLPWLNASRADDGRATPRSTSARTRSRTSTTRRDRPARRKASTTRTATCSTTSSGTRTHCGSRHTTGSACSSPAASAARSPAFGALLNGAAMFPFDVRGEGPRGWRVVREERLTVYHSVPTIFRSFLAGGARFPDVGGQARGGRSSR